MRPDFAVSNDQRSWKKIEEARREFIYQTNFEPNEFHYTRALNKPKKPDHQMITMIKKSDETTEKPG